METFQAIPAIIAIIQLQIAILVQIRRIVIIFFFFK